MPNYAHGLYILYDPAIAGCPQSSLLRMQIDISKVYLNKISMEKYKICN